MSRPDSHNPLIHAIQSNSFVASRTLTFVHSILSIFTLKRKSAELDSMSSVPSPGNDSEIFRFTDEGIAQYVEFPKDTIFIESIASNESFNKGVGYVAAQRKSGPGGAPESFIYEITPKMTKAKELFGPVMAKGGSPVTVFGSAITSTGILYLCAFNRNSVICYDLNDMPESGKPAVCNMEIPNLPSPNDMCIDPNDEMILYVCGGSFRKLLFTTFTNSANGQVFKVQVNEDGTDSTVTTVKKGFDALAGIEVVGNDVWTAQLYDIFSLDHTKNYELTNRWKGNDGAGNVWLADNIDVFDDNLVLSPAYSIVSERLVQNALARNFVTSAALFIYQIFTACTKCERLSEALLDPEVSLALSNTYIQEGVDPLPVRMVMMTPDGSKYYHFEIDLVETRANHKPWEPNPEDKPGKMREHFNEQVTHASHLRTKDGAGYVVCVSFEEPRILLLKDAKFKECIAKKDRAKS